jgi:2-iminobutanoate/2-iminopropanoate deaminase
MRRSASYLARSTLLAAYATLAACSAAPVRERDTINPPGASTLAPYSAAVRAGGLVFLSGQVGLRPGTSELVGGGIAAETRQALENVRGVLRAANLGLDDVVKCTVFLADMRDYAAMNDVYGDFFRADPPARSAVGVNGLPLGARVEIECIARDRT